MLDSQRAVTWVLTSLLWQDEVAPLWLPAGITHFRHSISEAAQVSHLHFADELVPGKQCVLQSCMKAAVQVACGFVLMRGEHRH